MKVKMEISQISQGSQFHNRATSYKIPQFDEEARTFLQRVIPKEKFYVQLSIVIHNVPLYIGLIKTSLPTRFIIHSLNQIIIILFIM